MNTLRIDILSKAARRAKVVFLVCLWSVGAASCAKASSEKASDKASGKTIRTSGAASVCARKIVSVGDVAGILRLPITEVKDIPGDPQSCEFKTSSFPSIMISYRPGLGRATVDTWAAGKMPSKATPLAGVGDSAVWVDDLHEVDAQKDNALCVVTANGAGRDFAIGKSELQKRLGGLCNAIFAAGR